MTFSDPIVAGTELIRDSIHSSDYVAGTSGWSVNADGSAEFQDVVVTAGGGSVLIDEDGITVSDSDGSQVRIYDEDPGNGAIVSVKPADIPAHTIDPGGIETTTNAMLVRAYASFRGPAVDGNAGGVLSFGTTPAHADISLIGDEIALSGSASSVYVDLSSGIVDVNGDLRVNGVYADGGLIAGTRYNSNTTISSGIAGTEAVTGMTTGLADVNTSSRYLVKARVRFFPSSSALSYWLFRIRKTNTSGFQYAEKLIRTDQNAYGDQFEFSGVVAPGSNNTSQYVLTCQRLSGTATMSILSASNDASYLYIERLCKSTLFA
jgi:hypothetical protein